MKYFKDSAGNMKPEYEGPYRWAKLDVKVSLTGAWTHLSWTWVRHLHSLFQALSTCTCSLLSRAWAVLPSTQTRTAWQRQSHV